MSAAPPRRSGEKRPPRTLVVLGADWPAVAAAAADGALGGDGALPVAVVEQQRVIAALPAARAAGVRAGQRRREAEAHCPGLVVLARDQGAEVRAFEPAVRMLESFGVPVTVRQPGWASFPTRGPARRLGGEEGLVARVQERLGESVSALAAAAVTWHLGVADGPFAATAAARRSRVVPAGGSAAFLAPLGVELLGDPELVDLFRRLGLHRLGEVAALDEGTVLARFGAAGGRALRLARGLDGEAVSARAAPPELGVARILDSPAERLEEVVLVARGLTEELVAGLARRGLTCTLVRVEAETEAGACLMRCWSDEWGASPALLAERLRWQLEAWLGAAAPEEDDRPAPEHAIVAVRLVPLEAIPARGRQLGLFSASTHPDTEERTARVIARVQGMLGATAVLRPLPIGGRGPAERVQLLPVGDPVPVADAGTAPWPGRLPAPSPTVVPLQPPAVEVRDAGGAPVGVDARGALSAAPAAVALGGQRLSVSAWDGPFPADERWWDRRRHRRRARLQVITADGEGYLLCLEGGRWTVEGRYD